MKTYQLNLTVEELSVVSAALQALEISAAQRAQDLTNDPGYMSTFVKVHVAIDEYYDENRIFD